MLSNTSSYQADIDFAHGDIKAGIALISNLAAQIPPGEIAGLLVYAVECVSERVDHSFEHLASFDVAGRDPN